MKAHRKLWESALYSKDYNAWCEYSVTTYAEFQQMNQARFLTQSDSAPDPVYRMYMCFFALYFADKGATDVIEV